MTRIHIFKTDVESEEAAMAVQRELGRNMNPGDKWTFDLEDCDKVLRVESDCQAEYIIDILNRVEFQCVEL